MNEFNFNYDFSRLSAVGLQKSKITQREIISVFENLKSKDIKLVALYHLKIILLLSDMASNHAFFL